MNQHHARIQTSSNVFEATPFGRAIPTIFEPHGTGKCWQSWGPQRASPVPRHVQLDIRAPKGNASGNAISCLAYLNLPLSTTTVGLVDSPCGGSGRIPRKGLSPAFSSSPVPVVDLGGLVPRSASSAVLDGLPFPCSIFRDFRASRPFTKIDDFFLTPGDSSLVCLPLSHYTGH